MRILYASSEAHPLIKTGGLADVSGSLPPALAGLGYDARLILPAYPLVKSRVDWKFLAPLELKGIPGDARLLQGRMPDSGLTVYLLDAPLLFERAGNPYHAPDGHAWQDNHLRFGAFCQAITAIALRQAGLDWQPDLVHCNDWQTGLVPALLSGHPDRPSTVFTIHNLAYQGLFPYETLHDLHLPPSLWTPDGLEFYGQLSFIKGGLAYADRITTVSPTYAREILTPDFGNGLQGMLAWRASVLSGILNGIDQTLWDPGNDAYLPEPLKPGDRTSRRRCRATLCDLFQLNESPDAPPLLGLVGRLVEQKGIDLVLTAIRPFLLQGRIRVVILGTGEARYEQGLQALSRQFPGKMVAHIGFDESLAHHIEAGADAFLMPSRFEPCGLNQMYSLRYGTPPLAHRTGGLADTIVDASPAHLADGTANGFLFDSPDAESMTGALERLLSLWDTPDWEQLIQAGTQTDFSWNRSASTYSNLYKSITYENKT